MPDRLKKTPSGFFETVQGILEKFNVRLTTAAVANLLAVVVGVLSGLGAVGFRYLIEFFKRFFFEGGRTLLFSYIGEHYVVLIPAIGGLIVGPLIYYFAREAKGHGVPEVKANIALHGGRIRPRVAIIKSLASSICIGSGGSVGREGPIVQIGSSLGSSIGQLFKLRPDLIKGLLACGAAGGISATFNAPLGGVIFAMEVILGNFTTNTFVSLALASFSAAFVAFQFYGAEAAFGAHEFIYHGPREILFYIMMGILSAVVAFIFVKMLYYTEDLWEKIKFPEQFKPVVGGLLIGGLGFYYPYLFGVGYEGVGQALQANLKLVPLLVLLVLKIIATSTTIGSGGSGGVFAPSLFVGAMAGGAFGKIVGMMYPGMEATAGAFSLVGMGAVFAAAASAPVTSIIILFELTDDYHLILPIMVSCAVSYLVFKQFTREDIYSLKLVKKGIYLHGGRDLNVLQDIMVRDIMGKEVEVVKEDMTVQELSDLIRLTDHMGFPVIDEKSELTGVVTFNDFQYIKPGSDWAELTVKDIYNTDLLVTYPDETLDDVMHKLGMRHVGRLPVVDRSNPKRILGLVTRTDIVNAYSKYLTFKKYE
ncbi:chloride channel protein [bacterium]